MANITKPKSRQPIPKKAVKVFDGVIFSVYQWDQILYDGTTARFEKLTRDDTVSVFPITSDKKIVLTKQEQPGIEAFISEAGGAIEKDEDILACAYREMVEETGYETENFDFWFSTQPSSKINSGMYCFFGRNASKTRETNPDGGERIEVFEVSFEEFIDVCADPLFRNTEVAMRVLRAARKSDELKHLKRLFLEGN